MSVLIMIASASAIIAFVKYGLLKGIDHIAGALKLSAKARGQITGFATSVPELVCLVSAGIAGVWEAGLWNIASSNIINACLMLAAILYFRQFRELMNRRFVDEIFFASTAIMVPIVLMIFSMDTHLSLVPLLLGLFVVYQVVDKLVNRPSPDNASSDTDEPTGSLPLGVILGTTALIAISVAGIFLGDATAKVVDQMHIQPAIAGWILGFVTSIPEMVTFFAVYATARKNGREAELDDTQEALDNLTGSNMANVGIVYPVGLLAFLLATKFLS